MDREYEIVPVFVPTDTDLRPISSIVPGASVGRLAAGERSVSTVKRLAERRKERSERNQPPNGSVAHLRRPQAGTNARGAKWAQGHQGARHALVPAGLVQGLCPKKVILDEQVMAWVDITEFPPPRSIQIRLEIQDSSLSKSESLSRSLTVFSCNLSPPSDSARSPQMLRRLP